MMTLRAGLSSERISERLLVAATMMLVIFPGITIISYFLLPEGVLRGRTPAQVWDESTNILILAIQILGFNLISVAAIVIGSLFATKKDGVGSFVSTGYLVYFVLISVNAVTLGTWSFSVEAEVVPIDERLMGMVDLMHRAGLWEMVGQLCIVVSLARIAIIRTINGVTEMRRLRDLRLTTSEWIVLATGFVLMIIGAVVESFAISSAYLQPNGLADLSFID